MARAKKSKPIAEHIEATSPETPPVENQVPPLVLEPPSAQTDELPKSHAERVEDRRPHGEPKGGVPRAQREPNPFGEYIIALGTTNDGPRMRLLRERRGRFHLAAVTFTDKPGEDVRHRLKEAGFSWHQNDQAWKKPLGEAPGVEMRKATELFEAIANDLRDAAGLPPVSGHGHGVA